MSTEDDAGRMVMHSHGRRFAVCYPILVQELPTEGAYEYMWQTQVGCETGHMITCGRPGYRGRDGHAILQSRPSLLCSLLLRVAWPAHLQPQQASIAP